MPDKNCVIQVKVPGKVMLSGEYAVMSGFSSLSLALSQYLTIEIKRSSDGESQISSTIWKRPLLFSEVKELESSKDILLSSIYGALEGRNFPPFHFSIRSDFSVSSGFGSSSALRLGVQYAFSLFEKSLREEDLKLSSRSSWALAERAFRAQKSYQKKASGYDFITQKEGGVLLYKPEKNSSWPNAWEKLDLCQDSLKKYLHIFVGGRGAATKEVMNKTDAWLSENNLKENFFELSEKLSASLIRFFEQKKTSVEEELVSLLAGHRALMRKSPFFPSALEKALEPLEGFDKTWTFKTTGSGGEDALLFFGDDGKISEAKKVLENLGWRKSSWGLDEGGIHYSLSSRN